jgi:uncharacterized protein YjeT (DUF2065 family)
MIDEIQQRISQLERDKRWWKRLALGLVVAFSLILVLGGIISISLATRARYMAQKQERAAMEAGMQARKARQ